MLADCWELEMYFYHRNPITCLPSDGGKVAKCILHAYLCAEGYTCLSHECMQRTWA